MTGRGSAARSEAHWEYHPLNHLTVGGPNLLYRLLTVAYTNRYIAIPHHQSTETDIDPNWCVRDTDDRKTLLGIYSKSNAEKLARRLNADINLSPGERRALDVIWSCYPMECSSLSIARAFKNALLADDKTSNRIIDLLHSHGLVDPVRGVQNTGRDKYKPSLVIGAKLTEWGKEWLSKR